MPDFTEVYREYFAGVYRYALALCGDPSLAEEITQETFFRSLDAIAGFRGDCPLSAWLCRIARRYSPDDRWLPAPTAGGAGAAFPWLGSHGRHIAKKSVVLGKMNPVQTGNAPCRFK